MAGRYIVNDPSTAITEALEGLAAVHDRIVRLDAAANVILRVTPPSGPKVGVVSGGGSGHEPLHVGFVGRGMLDAAVPGEIFTSPPPDRIVAAALAAENGAGVLLIVKNYSGDVLNFRMAASELGARGIEVESVIVNDDVAVEDSEYTAGRRGVAGTVFVEKIAGAAAERGESLAAVAAVARRVVERTRSFGIALSGCAPLGGDPIFELPDGEMEVGVGIHGEPGRRRQPVAAATELAKLMFDAVHEDRPLAAGSRTLTLTNGLGGTTPIELFLLDRAFSTLCADAGLTRARKLVGQYVTSLNMRGASFTVMELDDELLALWDDPVETPAIRW